MNRIPSSYKPVCKCKDCNFINPQFYWVKQSVWEEAGFKLYKDGIICLACLAKRINRPITLADFDDNGPCSNDAIKFILSGILAEHIVSTKLSPIPTIIGINRP